MYPRTIADFTGPCRGSGDELNYMVCPMCASSGWNTYVNSITGRWYCFASSHERYTRGGCVAVDDWTDNARQELLQMLVHGVPNTHTWPEVSLPEWQPLGVMARNYLSRRGVHATTCGTLGIVEMRAEPRILVPYKGPHGRIIHWTGRYFASAMGGTPKYMSAPGSKPLFMLPLWEVVPHAIVVEGVFDAIAAWQATGLPTIAIGGKSISQACESDLRSLVRGPLWLMLDGDAQSAVITLRDKLMDRFTCKIVLLEDGEDPGGLPADEIRKKVVA